MSRNRNKNKPFSTLTFLLGPLLSAVAAGQGPSTSGSEGSFKDLHYLGTGQAWLVPIGSNTRIPHPTIQAAVNAGSEGDTVLLSDGVFRGKGNRDILVAGKNLRIRSENGPKFCVIDCQGLGGGFEFQGIEVTESTLLYGVTVLNGFRFDLGGGVRINPPSTIVPYSTPIIEGCIFRGCTKSAILFMSTLLSPGGEIRDCLFVGNSGDDGGAVKCEFVEVENCIFLDNHALGFGGGIEIINGSLRNCLFAGNTALSSHGGGVSFTADDPSLMEGCTIVNNTANRGGGLVLASDSELVISSTILWGNTSTSPLGAHQVWITGTSPFIPVPCFRYCTIEGGESGVILQSGIFPPKYEGLSELDPLFVDLDGRDYHLSAHSPCIDGGDPLLQPVGAADLDHEPRLKGRHDIGVDEHYTGLSLSLPWPARAGETNAVRTRGGRLGDQVCFYFSTSLGSTPIGFGACPSLTLDLAAPLYLGSQLTNGQGNAIYRQHIGSNLSGVGLALQAVGFDPTNPGGGCTLSNPVTFTYP